MEIEEVISYLFESERLSEQVQEQTKNNEDIS